MWGPEEVIVCIFVVSFFVLLAQMARHRSE